MLQATIPHIIRHDEGLSAAASSNIARTTTGKRSWEHCDTPSTYLDQLVKCGMQGRTIDMKCCLHTSNRCLNPGSLVCIPYASHISNSTVKTNYCSHCGLSKPLRLVSSTPLRLSHDLIHIYIQLLPLRLPYFRLVEGRLHIYIQLLPSSNDSMNLRHPSSTWPN